MPNASLSFDRSYHTIQRPINTITRKQFKMAPLTPNVKVYPLQGGLPHSINTTKTKEDCCAAIQRPKTSDKKYRVDSSESDIKIHSLKSESENYTNKKNTYLKEQENKQQLYTGCPVSYFYNLEQDQTITKFTSKMQPDLHYQYKGMMSFKIIHELSNNTDKLRAIVGYENGWYIQCECIDAPLPLYTDKLLLDFDLRYDINITMTTNISTTDPKKFDSRCEIAASFEGAGKSVFVLSKNHNKLTASLISLEVDKLSSCSEYPIHSFNVGPILYDGIKLPKIPPWQPYNDAKNTSSPSTKTNNYLTNLFQINFSDQKKIKTNKNLAMQD